MISSSWLYSKEDQEEHPILTDKFQLGIGTFFPSKTLDLKVDGSDPNENIEFGSAFGLNDSETTLLTGFDWRFVKKWKLSFEYFGLKDSKKRVLEEDIH